MTEHRGRRSAADLSIVTADGIVSLRRPEPLPELTTEQASEWREIVNRLPAEWFPRETHGMLAQYCRHTVSARRVASMLATYEAREDFEVETYDRLLKMQEREGRALSSLATRMRISQQSSFDKEKKKGLKLTAKPWEFGKAD